MNLGDLTLNIIINTTDADRNVKQFSASVSGLSAAESKAESNTRGLEKSVSSLGRENQKTSATVISMRDNLANVGLAYMGLTAVVSVFQNTLGTLLGSYQAQEVANAKLLNNLKNTGEGIEAFRRLASQASDLQMKTAYADEEIIDAQAMLGTFKKTSEQIEMLTPRMLDLSAAYDAYGQGGKRLVEIAVMLGKVSPETIGTLRRVGVAFSKEDEILLQSLSGMEQTIFLSQILDSNFKGLAETVGNTSAGKLKILKNSIGEIQESLGQFISAGIAPASSALSSVLSKGGGMSDFFKVITLGAMAAAAAFVVLNTSMGGIPYIAIGVTTALTALYAALHPVSVSADDLKQSIEESIAALADYSNEIDKTSSNIQSLELVYNTLINSTVLSESEQSKYEAALARMSAVYPQIMSQVDEYSGRLTTNVDVLGKLISSEKERLEIVKNARTAEQLQALDDMIAKYKDAASNMSDLLDTQKRLQEELANGEGWRTNPFTGNQKKVGRTAILKELDDINIALYQIQSASDLVAKAIYDAIEQGIKFGNVELVIERVKSSVQGAELTTRAFFSVMSLYTGQAISDWSQIAKAIQIVKNLMSSTSTGVMGPEAPTKSNIESRISDINKLIDNESNSKKIQEYKADIKALENQRDKLLGVEGSSRGSGPGRGPRGGDYVEKESDAVKELIDTWSKQIEIYYTALEFQSKFSTEGKSLADVFAAINSEIKDNTGLTDDQVLSLVKYRDTVLSMIKDSGGSLNNLFSGGTADDDPNSLAEKFAKQRMAWYENFGSKDKRFKPLDESIEYVEALKLIKEFNQEKLKESDYQSFIVSLKERANKLDVDSEKSMRLRVLLNQEIADNEQAILDIRRRESDLETDVVRRRIQLSDDEYAKRRANIELEYRLEINRLNELEKKAVSQKEFDDIKSLRELNVAFRRKQLDQADQEEIFDKAFRVTDAFSGAVSNAQLIARLFGSSGDDIVEGFQRALAIAQAIKGVFETISLIRGLISLFSAGAGAGIPVFHDGGIPGGLPGADVPIIAQEGEGIIRRPRMKQLASVFGDGFFQALNGSGTPDLRAFSVYHSGGVVAAASGVASTVVEVPYVLMTDISGATLKLILARQDKIDRHRSTG